MNKVEELTGQIQELENNFAEALAAYEGQNVLSAIWKTIKHLRDQLLVETNKASAENHSKASKITYPHQSQF